MTRQRRRWITAAGAAAAVVGIGAGPVLWLASAGAAASSSLSQPITIGSKGGAPTLSPASAKETVGQAVTFDNSTGSTVQIAVDGQKFDISAKGSDNSHFTPVDPGSFSVKATFIILGVLQGASGSGDIDATKPAASSSASPTKSAGQTPHPGKSTPTTGPDVAPSPSGKHHHKGTKAAGAGPSPTVSLPPIPGLSTVSPSAGPGQDPLVAPGVTTGASSSSTDPADPSGTTIGGSPVPHVDPHAAASNSGGGSRGLQVAVALVLIVASGLGLWRVQRRR